MIVGPDEVGHRGEVEQLVGALGLQQSICFRGEARDEERSRMYGGSELFILPSFSENFGLVIGEALAHGVPVITTRATPWPELERERCGWWIEVGVEPLVKALTEAVQLPREALTRMGERGRRLIKRRYSWERAGEEMAEVYGWMLGRRKRPECVMSFGEVAWERATPPPTLFSWEGAREAAPANKFPED
jgi:glycosyltransferase involved in cell wall biosynthesis